MDVFSFHVPSVLFHTSNSDFEVLMMTSCSTPFATCLAVVKLFAGLSEHPVENHPVNSPAEVHGRGWLGEN